MKPDTSYENYHKTMDLLFVGGKLHQRLEHQNDGTSVYLPVPSAEALEEPAATEEPAAPTGETQAQTG